MSNFITAFENELVKQAGHPLFETVASGGTLLGQKVRGMVTRVTERANKIRKKTMKGGGLKKRAKDLTAQGRKHIKGKNFALAGGRYPIHDLAHARNALARVAQHGSAEEQATVRAKVYAKYPALKKRSLSKKANEDDMIRCILEGAKGSENVIDKEPQGAEDTRYGGGTGNFKGRRAPAFTSTTEGGKLGNPTENPERFGTGCGPRYGCGDGKHGTGCGMSKKAGWAQVMKGKQSNTPFTQSIFGRKALSAFRKARDAKPQARRVISQPIPVSRKMTASEVASANRRLSGKKTAQKPKQKPKLEVGKAKPRVAVGKPKSTSLGASSGGGLSGNLKPSFMQGGSKLPQRASMASLGKKPGFGEAGKLRAPKMPSLGGAKPAAPPAVASKSQFGLKKDITAPSSRTSYTTGKSEAG